MRLLASIVGKLNPGRTEAFDLGGDVVDDELDPVPTTGCRLGPSGIGRPAEPFGSLRRSRRSSRTTPANAGDSFEAAARPLPSGRQDTGRADPLLYPAEVPIEVDGSPELPHLDTSATQVAVSEGDAHPRAGRAAQGTHTPLGTLPAVRAFGVFLAYAFLSVAIWGRPVIAHLDSRFVTAWGADSSFFQWALGWTPWALAHGHSPLFSDRVFAPHGVDLTWVTICPGPALVMAPITRAFGTLVSLNLLSLLGPPVAAWAAFLVCVRLTRSFWPSFMGGFLYGFCTYITGQLNHPNLLLVFPIPLIVYLVIRRIEGSIGTRAFVVWIAVTLLALFSVSTEVFATAALFGAIAWCITLILAREDRRRVVETFILFASAYALVAAIVLVPYILPALRTTPGNIHAPEHSYDDLLRFVVPRDPAWIGGGALSSLAYRFTAASLGGGAYLGVALVVLLVMFATTERRRRGTWGLLAFILVSALLTMGPALHVAGHRVTGLPTAVIGKLPLIRHAIPDRFPAYTDLAVAVVAAMWLSRARGPFAWSRWALAGVAAAMLVPNITTPPWHADDHTPAFFRDQTYASVLRPDENVFIIPTNTGEEMAWQAAADFSFRMPQGYPIPIANRRSRLSHGLSTRSAILPSREELASWLNANGVTAVVVSDEAQPMFDAVLRSVGLAPVYEGGGVSVWRTGSPTGG
jgi:hypothetical protein